MITVDNGPELGGHTAMDESAYCRLRQPKRCIRPCKPVENAFAELCVRTERLRDECLHINWYHEHQTFKGCHRVLATGLQ